MLTLIASAQMEPDRYFKPGEEEKIEGPRIALQTQVPAQCYDSDDDTEQPQAVEEQDDPESQESDSDEDEDASSSDDGHGMGVRHWIAFPRIPVSFWRRAHWTGVFRAVAKAVPRTGSCQAQLRSV